MNMTTNRRIVLAFLLFPVGIWCDDTCTPSGYTRLNATNFIKAVASRSSFDVHLQAVQDEATAFGNNSIKGRLAIVDNQTKYELAKGLMQANGILEAWLGMKCFAADGDCADLSKWDWTEDGSSEYLSVEEGWLPENVTTEYDEQQCMRILLDYMGRSEWDNYYCHYAKGAIYELVVEDYPCVPNPCNKNRICVPCFLNYTCQPRKISHMFISIKNKRRSGTILKSEALPPSTKKSHVMSECSVRCFRIQPQCVAFNVVINGGVSECQLFGKVISATDDMLVEAQGDLYAE